MKLKDLLLTAMIMTAAVSCAKEQYTTDQKTDLTPMTFKASVEDSQTVKTTYVNRSIFWEETDAISVFFKTENNVVSKQTFTITELTDDKSTATFGGLGTPSETYVAVYPDLESNAFDGTVLTMNIPSVQTAVPDGIESGANASVAYSHDETLVFRNIGSLIAFRFPTQEEAERTASVTFKAKSKTSKGKFAGISGISAVSLVNDGNQHIPAAAEGSTDYITVNAPEGGFTGGADITYFAVTYPFECNGFEVTFTLKDGGTIVMNSDTPATVIRNTGLSLGDLSASYKLPEEFEVKIDFSTGWPFKEGIYAQREQATTGSGDIYTLEYNYTIDSKPYTTDLKFYMFGGGANYTYHSSSSPYQFRTTNANSRILLPGIEGRYLKSVAVEVNNASPNNKKTQIVGTDWLVKVNGPAANNTSPAVITLPCDYFFPERGTSYYLRFPDKNLQLTTVTLTYSRYLDGNVTSGGTTPTGHFSLMQMTNAGTSQMMSYILKTDGGKVIMIDGGNSGLDAEKLRGILKDQYGNHVDMWWITHPHSDHVGALSDILKDKQNLTIDYIMHSRFSEKHLNREPSQSVIAKELYALMDAESSAKTITVIGDIPSGASYNIDGVFINVLGVTNEEIAVNAYNNSSMILRFEDKDKSVLFLGDAGVECGDKAFNRYRDLLDCDYVQMAHHGQKGVSEEFYKGIQFRACLWPTPKWLWDAADGNANDWKTWLTRQWMTELGIQEHHVMWEEIDWFIE